LRRLERAAATRLIEQYMQSYFQEKEKGKEGRRTERAIERVAPTTKKQQLGNKATTTAAVTVAQS
jgi:hypothetical protein